MPSVKIKIQIEQFNKTFKITITWHSILHSLWQSTSLDIVEYLKSNHILALILGRRFFKFYYIKSIMNFYYLSLFLELAGFIFLKVSRSPRTATILLPPMVPLLDKLPGIILITMWQFWSWPWSMTSVEGNIPPAHRQPFCQVWASDISSHQSYGPDSFSVHTDEQTDKRKVIKG